MLNMDGEINILDMTMVAQSFGEYNEKLDVHADGEINILDIIKISNRMNEPKQEESNDL